MGNMIEVVGPDGTVVEFPSDTPRDVMTRVMRQHFGFQEPQAPAPSEPTITSPEEIPPPVLTRAPQVIDRAPEEFPPGIGGAGPVAAPPVGAAPVAEAPILPAEASISSFVKGREPEERTDQTKGLQFFTEVGRGAMRAATSDLPSMWQSATVLKDVGAAATIQQRLNLFDQIERGEITSEDQLRGLDLTSSQARSYLATNPETRSKMRQRLESELGKRKELVDAAVSTINAYKKDAQKYQPAVGRPRDIGSVTDFANWVGSTIGAGAVQMVPLMLAAAATGGVGLGVTAVGMGVGESVLNRLDFIQKEIKDLPVEEQADKILNYLQTTGDTSLLTGILSGSLDVVLGPAARLVRMRSGAIAPAATRGEAAIREVKAIPSQMAQEGLTGGAQQAIQVAGAVATGETPEFASRENLLQILEAVPTEAVGSLGGSAVNVGLAAAQRPVAGRIEPTLPEVIPEAPGRAEPTIETEPTVEGRPEPTLPAEEEPVVLRPTRRGPPVEETVEDVPAIPGMPSIEEPSYVFTPIEAGVTPVAPAVEEPPVEPVVAPTPAAAATPETPTVPPVAVPKVPEPEAPQLEAQGLATVEVPLDQLKLSKEVPQFKLGATAKGVVEPLGGKFERTGVAPIQVWRRLDGSLEVISGRHRLDLAQRSGEKTIPAQIHDEAQGFTRDQAVILDAELNIRDGQGKAKDYVNYFKASGIDRETAESRGLLARATGKRAYTIATQGSDELLAALRADSIPEEAAFYIALNAPNDSRIQAVGINAMNNGKTMNMAVNTMQAVQALAGEQGVTVDMFGLDDSAIREAEAMAKIAARKQRELQTRLSAITGASKNPALAKAEGIDIKDPEAVKRRIEELRQQKAAWENWQTNPDLIAEVRAERGTPPPELQLTGETEAEIRAREEAEKAGALEAEKRRQADLARDMFTLEGEAAPVATKAPEQGDIFAEPAKPKTGLDATLPAGVTDPRIGLKSGMSMRDAIQAIANNPMARLSGNSLSWPAETPGSNYNITLKTPEEVEFAQQILETTKPAPLGKDWWEQEGEEPAEPKTTPAPSIKIGDRVVYNKPPSRIFGGETAQQIPAIVDFVYSNGYAAIHRVDNRVADVVPITDLVPALEPKTGEVVQISPLPENMETRVFKTSDGYGTGLFDKDSGNFVDGSITRFKGDDARAKAEKKAQEVAKEATPENQAGAPENPIEFMENNGFERVPQDSPDQYKDAGGNEYFTMRRGPVRIALEPNEALFVNERGAVIRARDIGDYTIAAILVDQDARGTGEAKRTLELVSAAADQFDAKLYLEPVPLMDKPMSKEQLINLYKSFGFVQATPSSDKVLVREPGAKSEAPAVAPIVDRFASKVQTEGQTSEAFEDADGVQVRTTTSKWQGTTSRANFDELIKYAVASPQKQGRKYSIVLADTPDQSSILTFTTRGYTPTQQRVEVVMQLQTSEKMPVEAEAPAVAPEIKRLQKTYDDAKSALDDLGPEPPKPRTERQFFGKNGREGADPETVRRYDEGVKKYNSWKRKYGKLKKAEVDASNALFRATQPTKTQVKEETKLVEDTTKAVLEAKLNDFMVGDQVRFGNTPGVVIGLEGDYVRFRPDAARSPKAYQRVPKTSLTMVARPDTTSEVSYSKGQDSKFGEEAGQLNADMGGLIQLLGANMYASNLADVTVKELLQNAFDAVKGAVSSKKGPALYKTGSIEIKVDSDTRTISIKDNARGMTPEIVRDAFFTIAGSEKSDLDPSERSGGLGLAKMGFMLGSDRLQLDTVRDGVRIKVDTTAKDIANNNFKIVKSPAPKGEHGTTVTVTIPENYTDPRTGEAKPIWFPWSVRSISPLTKPLIGPVKVDVDINGDKQTLPVGTNFPEDKYQSFKANFDWGSADIYFGIERKPDTWQTNHQVLSSGVYQFDQEFTLNKEKIPYDIIVNVKPNVDAKHPDYPFENSRERFKGRLKNDIGSLTNYLGTIARGYEAAGLQESFKGIVSMPRVEAGADIAGMADKLKKSFGTQGAQAPSELKPLPKEVTITPTEVRDTRTKELLVETEKKAEKEKESTFKGEKVKESKDFMIDLKQDPKLPIFHNNTNVDFVEVGRDYGDPEQFFAELGTLMVEMKEDLAKSGIYGYEKLSPDNLFFAGISIDKDYGGVHIKVPYKAVLINPFYDWGARTLFGVRGNILNTMIHEIAHTGSMDHGVAHNGQMIKVEQYLNDEGLMDYYRDAILDVLRRHESTFTAMRDAYGRSTTKNTAKSLEDVQKDAAAASARGDRGRGADEAGAVPAGEGQGRGEGVRATAASRDEGEVGGRPGEAGRVEPADQEERERVDELLDEFNRPKVTGRELETVKSRLMPSTSSIRSTFREMIDNPSQAANMIFGPLNRGIAQARNYLFFSGAGLEEADAKRYANQVRTANDEATATLALDNMLHGNGIAVQFLMQGGLRYNPETKRIEATQADGSMLDVYINERALKNKLGDERGAMLAQGYFEAKRSKNIRDEMARLAEEIEVQKEALDDARARLRELEQQGAADRTIGQQQSVVDGLAEQYKETKEQLDEIVRINEEKVLMSDEEIDAFIDQDAVYPELRKMMDAWTATNRRLLGMMRQVRMISEKRYKRLMSIKDYVPWQRVQDDDVDIHYVGNPRSATNISKERAFKKGKVESAVAYIPDNMTDNIIRLTQSVLRQYAALRIVDEYATRDPETGKIKNFAKADRNKGRFDYISDGRRVVVEIKDPVIAEAVYGRDSVDLRAPEAIAAATNFMRRAITVDPFFQMSQVIKDAPTAAIVTGVRNPWALMGSVMTSFAKTVVNADPVADILRANGIGGFQAITRTPEAAVKRKKGLVNRSVGAATLEVMDHIGDASDFAARIAAYKRTMAETGDEALALYRAANVINFNRLGSSGAIRTFVTYVNFANAYLQSIDTLFTALTARGARGRDTKKALGIMAATVAQLTALTLAYSWLVGGDDEYQKLDDGTKVRNFFIPKSITGTDSGILIPINTSAAFIFKAMPELTYNMFVSQATKTPMDATRYTNAVSEAAAEALFGPEPVPSAIRPIIEIAMNRSFFTERPLTPRGTETLEKFQQFTDQTSELGKLLGQSGGLSPIEWDHLIRGTTGVAGMLAQYGSNMIGEYLNVRPESTAKQLPGVGRFIAPEVGRGPEALFYDLHERVRKATSTYKDLEATGQYEKAEKFDAEKNLLIDLSREMNRTEAKLKKINSEIRMLSRGREEGTAKERRKEITELQRDKQELLEGIEMLRKEAGL